MNEKRRELLQQATQVFTTLEGSLDAAMQYLKQLDPNVGKAKELFFEENPVFRTITPVPVEKARKYKKQPSKN